MWNNLFQIVALPRKPSKLNALNTAFADIELPIQAVGS
jgi:hypothetical protein